MSIMQQHTSRECGRDAHVLGPTQVFLAAPPLDANGWIKCTGNAGGCRLVISSSAGGCSVDITFGTSPGCEEWGKIATWLNANSCCNTTTWSCQSLGGGDYCIVNATNCVPSGSLGAGNTCTCSVDPGC